MLPFKSKFWWSVLMTSEHCIMEFPSLSIINDVWHGHRRYGGELFFFFFFCLMTYHPSLLLVYFSVHFPVGLTWGFTHGTRPLFLFYFACRMCGVYLEWPLLLSGQHPKPARNVLSCVRTRAAIRDILSCPTYRCTAGSTLVSVAAVRTWAVVVHELPFWTLLLLRTQVTCGMESWHFQKSAQGNLPRLLGCLHAGFPSCIREISKPFSREQNRVVESKLCRMKVFRHCIPH